MFLFELDILVFQIFGMYLLLLKTCDVVNIVIVGNLECNIVFICKKYIPSFSINIDLVTIDPLERESLRESLSRLLLAHVTLASLPSSHSSTSSLIGHLFYHESLEA